MGDDAFADAGERLRQAVRAAFADGTNWCHVKWAAAAGLKQVTDRVIDALKG
jgi:hypothetical protein